MLRQLGNVFIVQPEILKSYLNESYLARIENRLLRPFVMMRSDYGEFGRRFWDDIFGDNVGGVLQDGTNLQGANGAGGVGIGGMGKLGVGLGSLSSLSSFGMNTGTTNAQPTSPIATSGGGGGDGSLGRKQSLFGNLMKDFEGLGLKDDAASEFGSKRGSVISTR